MPVPKHLRGIVVPRASDVDERPLSADVRCSCGGTAFELLYPGQTHELRGEIIPCTAQISGRFFFVLRAVCAHCSSDHLLFDADLHGWDGLVCHDSVQAAPQNQPFARSRATSMRRRANTRAHWPRPLHIVSRAKTARRWKCCSPT